MESAANQALKDKQKKEYLRQQIALLQSQLSDEEEPTSPSSKQKSTAQGVLVPRTPSPRKQRKIEESSAPPSRNVLSAAKAKLNAYTPAEQRETISSKPLPSKLVQRLARLRSEEDDATSILVQRTSSFTDKPPQPGSSKRDENLAIIESLELGPVEHQPPFDDPYFERVEPNSGIRLKSRILPHADLQDHLRGRYYLSPSRLYSSISLTPDKTGYDVPVDGDWITIAVVAERGPIKYTNPPVGIVKEEEANEDGEPIAGHGNKDFRKNKNNSDARNPRRRYVNVKLIDFGSRSASSSTTKGHIRGDAFLTLLLFEAEAVDLITEENGKKLAQPRKVYRGGSGGAFESMAKLKEGDVIALLNPRIMKPFTNSSTSNPHPVNNILAVNPVNASSISHIGRSLDLGMCMVQKRDGSVCGSWCDKRVSTVCEWHVTNAVQRRRAARSEFAVGTSGMTTSAIVKPRFSSGSSNYDPIRKTGLLPRDGAVNHGRHKFGGSTSYAPEATYVFSGHVINSANTVDATHVSEQMGREGQAKALRSEMRKKDDDLLKKMLNTEKTQGLNGGEGHVKSVLKAREVIEKAKNESKKRRENMENGQKLKEKDKDKDLRGKRKRSSQKDESHDDCDHEDDLDETKPQQSTASRYRPEMIKTLGFNPVAMKLGPQRQSNADIQRKLADLVALQKSRKEVKLGPRPGPRIRSGVFKPAVEPARFKTVSMPTIQTSTDIEQSNDAGASEEEMMVDLDSSDTESVI
ncbi:hypothetical protein DFJ43DRAFT_1083447 [Lentinula guzmanii]|uniref:Zinc finger Mcm10/DnaG-type domain-containing protein n=1 Tax=Lentinula guzmanii TaxID=2804957 RepID=A0AA38MZ90_9AGAR|nr:hypothetical protein DFJ43DRAFT_1083447 [Lentinula guzmanii]